LLIIIFSSIFFTTYQDITTRYNIDIDRLLLNVNIDNPQQSIEHNPGNNISFVLILENGIVIDTLSGPGLPQNVLDSAFGLIESDNGQVEIGDYIFKYRTLEVEGKTLVGFQDFTRDSILIRSLLIRYTIIFIISILLSAAFSFFITKKSVKPVEESYKKQKEFIANASHELKTPLTVMNTNIDVLLLSKELKGNKWLTYIKTEISRMNKLTNDLLYLAKTSEVDNTNKTEFNASTLIEGIVLGFEAVAFENKIELNYNLEKNINIIYDQSQFTQLLLVLIDNAIKYTPENESVNVKLLKNNKTTLLSVKNTGVSLSKDEVSNVFNRFYMKDKSREKSRNSYGLGLSIASEISKNNDSKLTVESVESEYTNFILTI